ncbi:MAG TPA: uroporphyrinogen decarboxylase family protein [Victivallales bacterium]|nr:uroporphyrinogen decarboxylase family protein [Victivallales bacterium]
MNQRERFLAVARFEKADYVPIFGMPGAPGMSGGCMKPIHEKLIAEGMPKHVGGCVDSGKTIDLDSWHKYWGTTSPIQKDFNFTSGAEGFRKTSRIENGFEIVESESGEITRQVIDNSNTYSMPEHVRYPVRDRESWEFYKTRITPRKVMSKEELEMNCRRFDNRERPLTIHAGSSYGVIRSLMGVEDASMALYDDPELVADIISFHMSYFENYIAPVVRRMKPEMITVWEDIGYNVGLLISPDKFREFCAPFYRKVSELAIASGVAVRLVDSDGHAMELVPLLEEFGFNALGPFEAKGKNDLMKLRKDHPKFIFFGHLEKEVVNEGNEHLIESEIMSKVPPLLNKGGYFPNGDHGIQPYVTFKGLCKFMSVLHDVCGNPEGEFPRI